MPETNTIVFLEGRTTILRPYCEETDLDFFTYWMNDQEMLSLLGRTPLPITREQERDLLKEISVRDNGVFLVICDKEDPNQILGTMSLNGISYHNGHATTGALLGPTDKRGKGYGSDAKMALLHYAFHTLGLRVIGASVWSTNPRSLGAMHKCGYTVVGTRPEWRWRNGMWVDEILTQVTREDFFKIYEPGKEDGVFVLDSKGNPRT